VRVSTGTIKVGGGAVEFIPQNLLQSDAHVQPRPEGRPTITERKIGNLGGPVGAIRAAGKVPQSAAAAVPPIDIRPAVKL
jgi:hypothetical protein